MLVGILFFSTLCSAQISLVVELFEEGEWNACLRESTRVLNVSPSHATARLLQAMASLRLNRNIDHSITSLKNLTHTHVSTAICTMAAYECGRAEWKRGRRDAALEWFQLAFHNTLETQIFLRSACSLFLLMDEYPKLKINKADLVMQINTSRVLWYGRLFEECRIEKGENRTRLLGRPGQWIVAFYRSQLSPAIGQRCSLTPSCSEYFLQACRKHGLLGFPMQGDRLVREPGVVMAGRNSVMVGDVIKYADPLDDHDFWTD